MMGLDSTVVIVIAVAVTAMILLVLGVFVAARTRRARKMAEVEQLINQLGGENALKQRLLETVLIENRGVDPETMAAIQLEVNAGERALLRRVIQMFLQHDEVCLNDIKQLIANLSASYCKLLSDAGYVLDSDLDALKEAEIENKIARLKTGNRQLIEQLDTAMQTIDEIIAKYTHEYGDCQSALEAENDGNITIFSDKIRKAKISATDLENSGNKMMKTFLEAEQRITSSIAEEEEEAGHAEP